MWVSKAEWDGFHSKVDRPNWGTWYWAGDWDGWTNQSRSAILAVLLSGRIYGSKSTWKL